ncbi:uncharacterized protein LOC124261643 [Haliotis rubra]|uniref:uncharacterized protein LOC124261643 n=1 Tax=Haliotis rubra TaxID=36100 RepID=UPI001EE58375|nr:uncharacterized protein LOC124261643 [Haliotis rubra]
MPNFCVVSDRSTQNDDGFMADVELKHKMDMEELKTKIDSDEKEIGSLTKLTDMLNSEIKSLNKRIDEKETTEKRDAKTIDFLLGIARECGVHLLKPGAVDRSFMLKYFKEPKWVINVTITTPFISLDKYGYVSETRNNGTLITSFIPTKSMSVQRHVRRHKVVVGGGSVVVYVHFSFN